MKGGAGIQFYLRDFAQFFAAMCLSSRSNLGANRSFVGRSPAVALIINTAAKVSSRG